MKTDKQVLTVPIERIKIRKCFAEHPPGEHKMQACRDYYKEYGMLDREIVINGKYVLVDGYVAYLVAKEEGFTELTVTMRFTHGDPILKGVNEQALFDILAPAV